MTRTARGPAVLAGLGPTLAPALLAGFAAGILAALVSVAPADAAPAPGDLATLKERIDELAAVRGAPPAVSSWWVDARAGAVVLATTGGARDPGTETFVAEVRRANPGAEQAVRVSSDAAPVRPRGGLQGGDAIYAGGARCSVAFAARDRAGGATRVITAGHCATVGVTARGADGAPIGSVRASSYGRSGDFAVVDLGPSWRAAARVSGPGDTTIPVTGAATAPIGASVCRSGSTSGYQCGQVTATDVTANYGGSIVGGLTQTTACSEPGDSGGPFVSGSQALGLLSGGSGDCRTGGATLYQPIEPVLARQGLVLATG